MQLKVIIFYTLDRINEGSFHFNKANEEIFNKDTIERLSNINYVEDFEYKNFNKDKILVSNFYTELNMLNIINEY
jgi:hypothetical protein